MCEVLVRHGVHGMRKCGRTDTKFTDQGWRCPLHFEPEVTRSDVDEFSRRVRGPRKT